MAGFHRTNAKLARSYLNRGLKNFPQKTCVMLYIATVSGQKCYWRYDSCPLATLRASLSVLTFFEYPAGIFPNMSTVVADHLTTCRTDRDRKLLFYQYS